MKLFGSAVVLAGVALFAAACNGGTTPAAVPSAAPSASLSPQAQTGAEGAPPGISGTIAAVNGSSLQVQSPSIGEQTVLVTSGTRIIEIISGSSALVATGDCVRVIATPATAGAPAATSVAVSTQVSGKCSGAAFNPFKAGGNFPGFSRGRSAQPRRSPRARFSGPPRVIVSGRVTALSATAMTVLGVQRSLFTRSVGPAPSPTSISVGFSGSTVFTKTQPGNVSGLAVGECVTAFGPTSTTGAVTARTLTVSHPGPTGCTGPFGRFGGGRTGGGGTSGVAAAA